MINTLPRGVYAYLVELPIVAYQQFGGADFPIFFTYSSGGLSAFPSYLKLVLPAFVKYGSCLLPTLKKKFRFDGPSRTMPTSTAPSIFPAGDVSGKVWSTLITTQQEGLKARLASLLTRACIARAC